MIIIMRVWRCPTGETTQAEILMDESRWQQEFRSEHMGAVNGITWCYEKKKKTFMRASWRNKSVHHMKHNKNLNEFFKL